MRVRLLAVVKETGGGGGFFLCRTGLNIVGSDGLVDVGRGACFDARAYEGALVVEFGVLKLNPLDGRTAACLISASSLTILSSFASRSSGTLHPKVFDAMVLVVAQERVPADGWDFILQLGEFQ